LRLSLKMGIPPRRLLSEFTSYELSELQALEQIDPSIGPYRGDVQAAIVAQTVVGAFTGKPGKLENYMPRFESKPKEMATGDMKKRFQVVKRLWGRARGKSGEGEGRRQSASNAGPE